MATNGSYIFTIELVDRISQSMRTINVATERQRDALNKLQGDVYGAEDAMQDFGGSISALRDKINALRSMRDMLPASALTQIKGYNDEISELTRKLRELQNATEEAGEEADESASEGGGWGKLGKRLLKIGAAIFAVKKAYDGFQNVMAVGGQNEVMKTNLLTLTRGNVAERDDLFQQVTDYGQKTVYDKKGLLGDMQTMMGYGMSGQASMDALKQLGDISLGSSEKMSRLAMNVAQAYSTGKVTGIEERQFAGQGFNIRNILREGGETALADKKQLEYSDLQKAMEIATKEGGLFYNGAGAAGETTEGKKMQLSDAKDELLNKIYEVVQPLANNVLGWLGEMVGNIAETIGPMLQPLADMIAPLLQSLMDILTPVLGPLLEGIMQILTPIFELLQAILPPILDLVVSILQPLLDIVMAILEPVCNAIMQILPPILDLLTTILFPIFDIISMILTLLQPLLDCIIGILVPIIELIAAILKPILEVVKMILEPIVAILNQILSFLAPVLRIICDFLGKLLGGLLGKVIGGALKVIAWVINQILTFVGKIIGVIIKIFNAIINFFRGGSKESAPATTGAAPTPDEDANLGVTPTIPNAPGASAALKSAVGSSASSAASGGTRNTSINITIGDMIKECNFVGGATENQSEIERVFAEAFNRVLGMASVSAGVAV